MGQQQGLSYEDCDIGRLINTAARGFKIAVIVGYSRTGKIQLCKWSENSRAWSLPQHHFASKLYAIDRASLSARHRSVLKHAIERIEMDGGTVPMGPRYGGTKAQVFPHTDKLVRDARGNVHFSRAKGPRP